MTGVRSGGEKVRRFVKIFRWSANSSTNPGKPDGVVACAEMNGQSLDRPDPIGLAPMVKPFRQLNVSPQRCDPTRRAWVVNKFLLNLRNCTGSPFRYRGGMSSDFIAWVRSRERSQEERITVERITEEALQMWRRKHKVNVDYGVDNSTDSKCVQLHCNFCKPTLLRSL